MHELSQRECMIKAQMLFFFNLTKQKWFEADFLKPLVFLASDCKTLNAKSVVSDYFFFFVFITIKGLLNIVCGYQT